MTFENVHVLPRAKMPKHRGWSNRLFALEASREFGSAEHRYRLCYGSDMTQCLIGPIIMITAYNAAERNRALEDKFYKDLDKNPRARLARWVLVDENGNRSKDVSKDFIREKNRARSARQEEIRNKIISDRKNNEVPE